MDKLLIDPEDNITKEAITIPYKETNYIQTGPPEVISTENITKETVTIPYKETNYIQTGPPEQELSEDKTIKGSNYIQTEPILIEGEIPAGIQLHPINENIDVIFPEPVINTEIENTENIIHNWSLSYYIFWIFIIIVFIVLSLYFTLKIYLNKSKYVIKKNAENYKISLDDIKFDIKKWLISLQDWKDSWNQFLFNRYIDNGKFKVKKYKIPKNLIKIKG
jgi:hypothetical protein